MKNKFRPQFLYSKLYTIYVIILCIYFILLFVFLIFVFYALGSIDLFPQEVWGLPGMLKHKHLDHMSECHGQGAHDHISQQQGNIYHDARFARYIGEGTHATAKLGSHTLWHASCHLRLNLKTITVGASHSKEQSASQHPTCQYLGKESAETCTASLSYSNWLLSANLFYAMRMNSQVQPFALKPNIQPRQAKLCCFCFVKLHCTGLA